MPCYSQSEELSSEIEQITETLMHYIEGAPNGEPERLVIAFHPDFNLYSVTNSDSLRIWEGRDYVGRVKKIGFAQFSHTILAQIPLPGTYYQSYKIESYEDR